MKALIVEDSPVICERLHNMIDGIQNIELVGDADNEADAVRDICAIQPDLVILDLALARGTGMDVLRQIKSRFFQGTVVVLTNYAYPQYRKKCMELGADYFLDKSLDIETLGRLLSELAGRSRPFQKCATL
jgi:DNA-binding NarL/FixJ family response regulator